MLSTKYASLEEFVCDSSTVIHPVTFIGKLIMFYLSLLAYPISLITRVSCVAFWSRKTWKTLHTNEGVRFVFTLGIYF